MAPAVGSSNPAIIRSIVVLPEPEGPRRAKNSPSTMSRSMSSTATTSPKVLVTPTRRTAGVAALASVTLCSPSSASLGNENLRWMTSGER